MRIALIISILLFLYSDKLEANPYIISAELSDSTSLSITNPFDSIQVPQLVDFLGNNVRFPKKVDKWNSNQLSDRLAKADKIINSEVYGVHKSDSLTRGHIMALRHKAKPDILRGDSIQQGTPIADLRQDLNRRLASLDSSASKISSSIESTHAPTKLKSNQLLSTSDQVDNIGQGYKLEGKVDEVASTIPNLDSLMRIAKYDSAILDFVENSVDEKVLKDIGIGEETNYSSYTNMFESKGEEIKTAIAHYDSLIKMPTVDSSLVHTIGGRIEEKLTDRAGLDEYFNDSEALYSELEQLKDEEYVIEQGKNLVKEQTIDHFAGKEEKLRKSMKDLAKLKKKHANVQSAKNLPKFKPNEMKGKPLRERVFLGASLQVMPQDKARDIDHYVSLLYRATGKLEVGLAVGSRSWVDERAKSLAFWSGLIGYRAIIDYKVHKNLSFRIDPEVVKSQSSNDDLNPTWRYGLFTGVSNAYKLNKNFTADFQVLYNFLHENGAGPYPTKVSVRFGLRFQLSGK